MNENKKMKSGAAMTSFLDFEPGAYHSAVPEALIRPRAGDLCPGCQTERLDYDGLLNLVCPNCGVATTGCFT